MDQFFVKWLTAHGHADTVVDSDGVGVRDNATRLRAGLNGSKRHDNGSFVVEIEFTVRMASGGEITEFVAGIGETEEKAINDALLNFTLTTFHVVYKAFINAADPHMIQSSAVINGVNRDVIAGDILLRGGSSSKEMNFNSLRPQIQGAFQSLPLTPGPHWIKIVYSQNDRQPMTVSATLDNSDHAALTEAVKRLEWPPADGFYMAKQFIVVK